MQTIKFEQFPLPDLEFYAIVSVPEAVAEAMANVPTLIDHALSSNPTTLKAEERSIFDEQIQKLQQQYQQQQPQQQSQPQIVQQQSNAATTQPSTNQGITDFNSLYQNMDVSILMQEPTLILAIAVILEMILPLGKRFKLDGLMNVFIGLGRKVNRPGISDTQRAFAGFLLPTLILFFLLFLVTTLDVISGFDAIIALVVMVLVLELKFPQDRSILVYRALHEGFKDKAKDLLSTMVLRETNMLSPMGIAKAASESAILRIFSGWFAVMVWYLMLGIEGAVMMQTVNVLSRCYNYKLRGNYQFGRMIFRMQQILLFIPALVLMLCLLCSKSPWRHFITAKQAFSNYPAAVSGMVLGAVGGALNISLGGPRYYQGYLMRLPSVGGEHSPDEQSILYSMRKIRMCGLILLVFAIIIDLNF